MKHYDELEWIFYKQKVISEEKSKEMEEHLYECDECMDTFLSLIDNEEIDTVEEIVPVDFTNSVMDNIKSFKNKSVTKAGKVEKPKMTFKNIFGYYVAVATVVVILTWGGFFNSLVDILPKVAKSTIKNDGLNAPNLVFNMSEKIVNKTSDFIKNFQTFNSKEELK